MIIFSKGLCKHLCTISGIVWKTTVHYLNKIAMYIYTVIDQVNFNLNSVILNTVWVDKYDIGIDCFIIQIICSVRIPIIFLFKKFFLSLLINCKIRMNNSVIDKSLPLKYGVYTKYSAGIFARHNGYNFISNLTRTEKIYRVSTIKMYIAVRNTYLVVVINNFEKHH